MGSAITATAFPYFLTDKERYNPPDYFCVRIIEEIRFFFFNVEDPARNQKLSAETIQKLKVKVHVFPRKKG